MRFQLDCKSKLWPYTYSNYVAYKNSILEDI